MAMAGAVAIVAVWLPLRCQGYMTAGIAAMTLLLCIVFYHGTTAWWDLGFMYGTERHPQMVVGPGNNLGALLSERFNWRNPKEIVMTLSLPASIAGGATTPGLKPVSPLASAAGTPGWVDVDIQIRHLLISIYGALMVISCIAIARQWRRNDRRFLVAIIVPWLLFYAIPAQIHERYLLFGSTAAAIVVGCSFGLAALNIFLVLLTLMQTLYSMMGASWLTRTMDHPLLNADFARFFSKLRPDISWAVLVVTGVFFFAAFHRSRWSHHNAAIHSAELKGLD